DFNGRARRKEYWSFLLFNMIFVVLAMLLDSIFGIAIDESEFGPGPIYMLYVLAMFLPAFAVGVRRLHDVGKSGWMVLISLIPIIGPIWMFVLFVTDSTPGPNRYGTNPKEYPNPNPL